MKSVLRPAILLWFAAFLTLLAQPVRADERPGNPAKPTHCVVLLHGIGGFALLLKPMELSLEEQGYFVANVTYPSLSDSIESLAVEAVEEGLQRCSAQGLSRIHFVTHSMGGILVRQYLSQESIAGLERVVMLAPPNQGSRFADYLGDSPLGKVYEPDALAQLGTGEESVPRRLDAPDFELGIIAGTRNLRKLIPGAPSDPSDGVVTVDETKAPGMKDFLLAPATHTTIIWSGEVQRQTAHFLRTGRFDHSSPED
ncbi:MAG: alpha/beta fold hydrolase [Gammaproteobacteria bacterium]|nr:alpha/beta fold hydrolase [Gammaproteobacteria bacterium]MXW44836.1 alpha/beta fold hydrolase [Gammaproteobacteria bacterium]MYD02037.1 alpha/beta fold hydrolase [Gammaproteobacteria bacterium]MYI24032.1 alpha/beta fold hydrolase [Gammaproteobacteria bacterium]